MGLHMEVVTECRVMEVEDLVMEDMITLMEGVAMGTLMEVIVMEAPIMEVVTLLEIHMEVMENLH